MDKMIKTAKNLDSMAKTVYWVCAAGAVICAFCGIITIFMYDALFRNSTTSLALGPVYLDLTGDGLPAPETVRGRIVAGSFIVAVILVFASMAMRIVRNILEPMSKGLPFSNTVSTNLHRLAVVSLLAGAFIEIAMMVHMTLTYNSFHLEQLFNSELVSSFTLKYNINIWFILVFVILQLMSYVFKYGEELQRLSDETL